jgi:hypothetical protein
MPTVLDRYDDNDHLLRKVFRDKGIPELVTLSVDVREMRDPKLAEFAAEVVRDDGSVKLAYPLCDIGNTVASAIYFDEYGDDLPPAMRKTAAAKIVAALECFELAVPTNLSKTAMADAIEPHMSDEVVLDHLFGETEQRDIATDIEDLLRTASPHTRRRMVKQAAALGPLPESMDEWALYGRDTVGGNFLAAVELRKIELMSKTANAELDDLCKRASALSVDELADNLYTFDIDYGLTALYYSRIPDPFQSVLGSNITKVAEPEAVTFGDRRVAVQDLRSFSVDKAKLEALETNYGPAFTGEFKNDPVDVFKSLPTSHQTVIANLIED